MNVNQLVDLRFQRPVLILHTKNILIVNIPTLNNMAPQISAEIYISFTYGPNAALFWRSR